MAFVALMWIRFWMNLILIAGSIGIHWKMVERQDSFYQGTGWYDGHRSGEGGRKPIASRQHVFHWPRKRDDHTVGWLLLCRNGLHVVFCEHRFMVWPTYRGFKLVAGRAAPMLTGAGLLWWPLRAAATGAGQLLLLGNGRTDKDQRRGLPKGPYNIGWPQPPPEAVVNSAAPPRCSKASWSHTRLHKVECRCCWSWERKSFPSTERTGEYQRFDDKYKYPVLFSSLLWCLQKKLEVNMHKLLHITFL